jgi:hypothetical protein
MAGVGPADVGSVQAYENFTGGVVMALAEHGFFAPAEANDFMTLDTSARPGPPAAEHQRRQPGRVLHARLRTGGRGGAPGASQSTAQAARPDVALVIGGPLVTPVSSLLLGSEATR